MNSYSKYWCKRRKIESLLKMIYVSKGLMPSRVDQSLRVAKMKRRRDQILNLVQKVSTSGQNIAPRWSTILQRKNENRWKMKKDVKYTFKKRSELCIIIMRVIAQSFNYMAKHYTWIVKMYLEYDLIRILFDS